MSTRRKKSEYLWVGGTACLDFSNTQSYRPTDKPLDRLETYDHLLDWARFANLLTAAEQRRLRQHAAKQPRKAKTTLARAKSLRETIYRLCSGHANQQKVRTDLHTLNQAAREAQRNRELVATANGFQWHWQNKTDLRSVLWPLALSTQALIASDQFRWVTECSLATCSAVFLDSSKNKKRRWCDMKDCGNLAKARTHRARTRSQRSA